MVVTFSTSPQTTTEAQTSYTSTVRTIKALSTKHQRTVTSDQTTERELTTVVKTANTAANSRTKTTKEVRTSQSTESFTNTSHLSPLYQQHRLSRLTISTALQQTGKDHQRLLFIPQLKLLAQNKILQVPQPTR